MASTHTDSTALEEAGDKDPADKPDFSGLPDLVWVKVLRLLDLTDRYHLALTCSSLRALFDHPSVWSHASLELSVNDEGQMAKYGDVAVLRHKARVLQVVRVDVQKHYHSLSHVLKPEDISTLLKLPLSENLKSLTVILNLDISCFQSVFANNDAAHLSAVLDVLCDKGSDRLHVELVLTDAASSFFTDNSACEILDTLGHKAWYLRVASFSFPHGALSEEQQFSLYPQLTSTPTALLVSRFPSLRFLELNAVNLSDQLLHTLADTRCPLRFLAVHLKDCCDKAPASEADAELPELLCEAWSKLASLCPGLHVSSFIGASVTPADLSRVFKPVAPVTSVQCLCKMDKGMGEYAPFCLQHSQTLRRFSYNENLKSVIKVRCPRRAARGESLVAMVTECPGLRELVYVGEIHHEDVAQMAALERPWRSLVVREGLVLLEPRDKVYTSGCRLDPSPSVSEKQRELLAGMCRHVSQRLGYPWKPR